MADEAIAFGLVSDVDMVFCAGGRTEGERKEWTPDRGTQEIYGANLRDKSVDTDNRFCALLTGISRPFCPSLSPYMLMCT